MSIAVVMRMPTPREAAKGTRNCAWMARSSVRGVKPRKVVTEVRKMGRKRPLAPSMIASRGAAPSLQTAVDQ